MLKSIFAALALLFAVTLSASAQTVYLVKRSYVVYRVARPVPVSYDQSVPVTRVYRTSTGRACPRRVIVVTTYAAPRPRPEVYVDARPTRAPRYEAGERADDYAQPAPEYSPPAEQPQRRPAAPQPGGWGFYPGE